jgi:hypothetical protein
MSPRNKSMALDAAKFAACALATGAAIVGLFVLCRLAEEPNPCPPPASP